MTIFSVLIVAGLTVLCLTGMFIANRIQFDSYKNQIYLMDKLLTWLRNAYMGYDIIIHDARMANSRNIILHTMVENDFVLPEYKDTVNELIHADSDAKALSVATSMRKHTESEIRQLKCEFNQLLIKLNFDFPKGHKELRADIKRISDDFDRIIKDIDEINKKEEPKDETQDS